MSVMLDMIEINPLDNDSFLQVTETLTRIGLIKRVNGSKPSLYQSVYVLHKRGHYYLCHFKQLYMLDHQTENQMSDNDTQRLHNIAHLLSKWNLVSPISILKDYDATVQTVVVKHANKHKYNLVKPYKIGEINE